MLGVLKEMIPLGVDSLCKQCGFMVGTCFLLWQSVVLVIAVSHEGALCLHN